MKGIICGVVLALAACSGSRAKESETAASARTTPAAAGYESEGKGESEQASKSGVSVEQSLADYCNLDPPNAFFAYDSSQVRSPGADVLEKLSTCLNSEKLAGRKIEVIGHTDPRGSAQHNQELAHSRAQSVADFLASHGVARDRIQVRSMGETHASSRPEEYALERRVDVRLTEETKGRGQQEGMTHGQ